MTQGVIENCSSQSGPGFVPSPGLARDIRRHSSAGIALVMVIALNLLFL